LSLKETIETCRLAAADRGERLMLEHVTYQDLDHPAPVSFPEALYLKCVWLRRCP
jgi:23S rRNA (cytosine1962-C5)-methyltransferase